MERGSLLVQRKRLAGAPHPVARQGVGGQFERPDIAADAARHFVQRRAIGGHRVPHADKMNLRNPPVFAVVVFVAEEDVADGSKESLDTKHRVVTLASVLAIGGMGPAIKFGFVLRSHEALAEDQPTHDADREGAAAEAEPEKTIVVAAIVAAGELVDIDDVALQSEPERPAENSPRLERRRA